MAAGYSGTPLAKKLGIKNGSVIRLVNPPDHYFSLFDDMPADVRISTDKKAKKNLVHYFTRQPGQLQADLPALKKEIAPDGMIWVSWPKKTSKLASGLTEDVVRKLALQNGLVDVKVCAVDEDWSGLKLVIPVMKMKRGSYSLYGKKVRASSKRRRLFLNRQYSTQGKTSIT